MKAEIAATLVEAILGVVIDLLSSQDYERAYLDDVCSHTGSGGG